MSVSLADGSSYTLWHWPWSDVWWSPPPPRVPGYNYSCPCARVSLLFTICIPPSVTSESQAQPALIVFPQPETGRDLSSRKSLRDVIQLICFAGFVKRTVCGVFVWRDWQEAGNLPDRDTMPPGQLRLIIMDLWTQHFFSPFKMLSSWWLFCIMCVLWRLLIRKWYYCLSWWVLQLVRGREWEKRLLAEIVKLWLCIMWPWRGVPEKLCMGNIG